MLALPHSRRQFSPEVPRMTVLFSQLQVFGVGVASACLGVVGEMGKGCGLGGAGGGHRAHGKL